MAIKSMKVRIKTDGGGYSLYVAKEDAQELGLTNKLGERVQLVYDDKHPEAMIISSSLNFNPLHVLNQILNGALEKVSGVKDGAVVWLSHVISEIKKNCPLYLLLSQNLKNNHHIYLKNVPTSINLWGRKNEHIWYVLSNFNK